MTKEEIMAISPGRELDALVAEKVMGLETYRSLEEWKLKGMPHIENWSNAVSYPAYYHPIYELATVVPYYSTNVYEAWEVVEKMKAPFGVFKHINGGFIINWCYMFYSCSGCDNDCKEDAEIEAPTAPEAICKAAILISLVL